MLLYSALKRSVAFCRPAFSRTAFVGGALLLAGTALLSPAPYAQFPTDVTNRNFFGDVTFDRPLWVEEVPGYDSTYLVAQLFGGIKLMRHEEGEWTKASFDSVSVARYPDYSDNDGAGLLGLTLHPDYENNRKYYIIYNQDYAVSPRPGTLILAERTANATGLEGSGEPERVILRLEKPFTTHDGGTARFGDDGYLYIGFGDGGSSNDPGNRAQNPGVLFGKMLRIDVDGEDAYPDDSSRNFAIPEDNPFVDSAGWLPEIWAYGLRNPWRWDFHPETGEIWAGDVGQVTREEITRVPKGGNLGWKMWEGTYCPGASCPETGITEPVFEYGRSEGAIISVTGGVFHEGDPESDFHDLYLFGDFATGTLWALREDDGELVEYAPIDSAPSLVSIHKDSRDQLFVISLSQEWDYNGDWVPNTGTVRILESSGITSTRGIREQARPAAQNISLADLLENRDDYIVRGLDGQIVRGEFSGIVVVHEKSNPSTPQLMTIVQ